MGETSDGSCPGHPWVRWELSLGNKGRVIPWDVLLEPGRYVVGAYPKALIEDFRWHDLRHTWASWHVQLGTPLFVLKELGGWETLEMVKRYAHLAPEHLSVHAERISLAGVTAQIRHKSENAVKSETAGSARRSGGERGIRTPGTRTGTTDFESAAIDHSAISPRSDTSAGFYQGLMRSWPPM